MKTLKLIGVPLVAVALFVAAPYLHLEMMRTSVEGRDIEALDRYVDWPSVRQDVMEQASALTDFQSGAESAPASMGDALRDMFKGIMVELGNSAKNAVLAAAIETVVTPQGISGLYHGHVPDLGDDIANAMAAPLWRYATNDTVVSDPASLARLVSRVSVQPGYASWSEFVVPVFYRLEATRPPVRIARIWMERDGWLRWKVTHVDFEDDVRAVIARVKALQAADERQRLQRVREQQEAARLARDREQQAAEALAAAAAAAPEEVAPDVVAPDAHTPPVSTTAGIEPDVNDGALPAEPRW